MIITRLLKFLSIPGAVLLGNWVGGMLRFILTGEEVQTIQFNFTTAKGQQISNSPVTTKFFPGLLFAFLGKPRWLFAFFGGMLAGGLVPDSLEEFWLERFIEPFVVDRLSAK